MVVRSMAVVLWIARSTRCHSRSGGSALSTLSGTPSIGCATRIGSNGWSGLCRLYHSSPHSSISGRWPHEPQPEHPPRPRAHEVGDYTQAATPLHVGHCSPVGLRVGGDDRAHGGKLHLRPYAALDGARTS